MNVASMIKLVRFSRVFLYVPSLYILTRSSRKSLKMAVVLLRSVRLQFALEMETSSRSVPVEDAQNCDVVVIF